MGKHSALMETFVSAHLRSLLHATTFHSHIPYTETVLAGTRYLTCRSHLSVSQFISRFPLVPVVFLLVFKRIFFRNTAIYLSAYQTVTNTVRILLSWVQIFSWTCRVQAFTVI